VAELLRNTDIYYSSAQENEIYERSLRFLKACFVQIIKTHELQQKSDDSGGPVFQINNGAISCCCPRTRLCWRRVGLHVRFFALFSLLLFLPEVPASLRCAALCSTPATEDKQPAAARVYVCCNGVARGFRVRTLQVCR